MGGEKFEEEEGPVTIHSFGKRIKVHNHTKTMKILMTGNRQKECFISGGTIKKG